MSDTITTTEARKEAYDMAFDRFDTMESYVGDEWNEMDEDQQSMEIMESLSGYKEYAEFSNVVAPKLRELAEELADSAEKDGSDAMAVIVWAEDVVFDAFDTGAYDAYDGRERYASFETID